MLAFHVLSAFSLIAGMILFWILIVAGRRIDTPAETLRLGPVARGGNAALRIGPRGGTHPPPETLRLGPVARVGNATIGIGLGGTILFGVYLAFALDSYAIWDGWILAGLVLWFVASAVGRRTGAEFVRAPLKALELRGPGQ